MKNLFAMFSHKSNKPVDEPVAPATSDMSQQSQPQSQPEAYTAPVGPAFSSLSGDNATQQSSSVFGGLANVSEAEINASPAPIPIPTPPSYQPPSNVYSGPAETPSQPDVSSGYTPSVNMDPAVEPINNTQPTMSESNSDIIADVISQPITVSENNSPSQPTSPTVPPTNQF